MKRNQIRSVSVALLLVLAMSATACQSATPEKEAPAQSAPAAATESKTSDKKSASEPKLQSEVLISGLSHPWDVAQLPDDSLVFTERSGKLSLLKDGKVQKIADIPDVEAKGEGGLTGLALDPEFSANRYLYLAYNTVKDGSPEVRVTRFRLTDKMELESPTDIVTGIPAIQSGRHSGCQLEMGADGTLWIGTGDAATAQYPQDPKSLGGKILRVTRDGEPVEGNLNEPFDPRIFSYGHRNTQGIVLFEKQENGSHGYSAEHGSHIEDELNALVPGNFGWAPNPPYNEDVPMTDTKRFPDAVEAVWNSGSSTIAISGVTQLRGAQWGSYENAVVMGVLKGRQLRLLEIANGNVVQEKELLGGEYGRIRAAVLGRDHHLYLTTDNGNNDSIIRVTPGS